MKRFNDYRIRLMFVGFVGAVVLGGRSASVKADFTFGTPTKVPNVNSSSAEVYPEISADGLTLYFVSNEPHSASVAYCDIWLATRVAIGDEWDTPVKLGPTVNSSAAEADPSISTDGLALYFSDGISGAPGGFTHRPGGYGQSDLWVTMRAATDDPWGTPVNLGPIVNSSSREGNQCISADNLSLYFYSDRSGGYGLIDLWVTTRETTDADWGSPINLGPPVNSSASESGPSLSADGLSLFFTANYRSDTYGSSDLYMTTRTSTSDPWGPVINLGPNVNSSSGEGDPSISTDGSTLYFHRGQPGVPSSYDLWQVSIKPVVDFNGDGIVDAADMCIIVDHWGTDEPLCDIGPMPWGDGIVDVQDLIVLAEHLFEEVP